MSAMPSLSKSTGAAELAVCNNNTNRMIGVSILQRIFLFSSFLINTQ